MKNYWATKNSNEIGKEVLAKFNTWQAYLERMGYLTELKKSYSTFYGKSEIETIDGSLQAIHINHYANLIRHIYVMVTSTRPAWECKAVNSDLSSQNNTQLASGLLDFYMREKNIEEILNKAVENALYLREGWISLEWNVQGGEKYGVNPENDEPIYEGDIVVKSHNILNIARDINKKNMNHSWYIIREFQNKYDLAKKYPDLEEKIIGLSSNQEDSLKYDLSLTQSIANKENESDLIPVYTFIHDKTNSMPEGRYTIVLDHDVVPFDGPLPYKKPYLIPLVAGKKEDAPLGHCYTLDLLPIQDAFNMTVSSILTNQAANAVNNFQCPKGAAPRVTQVMDGMNVWEFDPKAGKLEVMELLRTAPEVFNFSSFLSTQAENISGVNQIARGNAPASLSGAAMALIQQQAIQFMSGIQNSYTKSLEQLGQGLIELLQTFAVVPRVAQIAGKSKKAMMKTFKGEDLKDINRVVVDSANPLTKTTAGRVEIANQLLQTQLIKTPEQYIQVLTSGNLEPLYEHENSQNLLIRGENEYMMEGKATPVLITDDDSLHVLEHSCVLNSPEARENPQIIQIVTEHIQAHINQAKTKDPVLVQMLKQMPIQMPQPQPMPNAGDFQNVNPITEQAEAVNLPEPAQSPI